MPLLIRCTTQHEGKGKDEGMITFAPPVAVESKSGRRKKYYDKIKDVIDRVVEKRNEDESKIADAFLAENEDYNNKKKETSSSSATSSSRPRRAAAEASATIRRPSVLNHQKLDLSWKDGGSIYPKQSSRVGDNYQVSEIPEAGTHEAGEDSRSSAYCSCIWNPKTAEGSAIADYIDKEVPSNKREAYFGLIDDSSQSLDDVKKKASLATPIDGSDWTEEEKEKFTLHIFRLRKDMKSLSQVMKKDMKSCLAYYLGTYKKSDHYRLLKTVLVDERNDKASQSVHGVDACAVCGDGGSLLICDGCEGEYHMSCVRPPLKVVPEGHWECDECVDRKFLEGRENIIRTCGLYEPRQGNGKKRKFAETLNGSMSSADDVRGAEDLVLRPTSPVLDAVRSFAIGMSKALSA